MNTGLLIALVTTFAPQDPATTAKIPAPELHFPPPFEAIFGTGTGTGRENVGRNLRLNQDTSGRWQDEVSLGLNPTAPDNLLASSNDYRSGVPVLGRYASFDGGKTIAADGTLPLDGWQNSGDPAVGFDGFGNGYIMGLHFNRRPLTGAIYVHKTTDGGRTFLAPVRALSAPGNLPDKPLLAIDQRTTGRFAGSIYITFTGFLRPPSGLQCVRSRDGGATWSSPIGIGRGQGTSPAVGPNGELYISWQNGNSIDFNSSSTGGVSFRGQQRIASITRNPSPLPPTRFRCNSFPATAVDCSTGPFRGRIHVCWSSRSSGSSEIFAIFSTNGGSSWSAPVHVNDATSGDQFFQWIAVDEAGTVYACWHDRRNDPNNRTYECYASASFDGGRTWNKNWKVSEGVNDPGRSSFIGDYSGLDARRGRAFATWVDFRRGNQDAFAAAVQTDLEFSPTTLSAAVGGTVALPIKAGPARANRIYVVVANISGINSGVKIGNATFFLNIDPVVSYSIQMGNTAPFVGFRGVLAAGGSPATQPHFAVQPGVLGPLIGSEVSFQYVLLDSAATLTYGSNPVSVRINM